MASVPDKMKAVLINSTGWPAPVELVEVPVPKVKDGQVLSVVCESSVLMCSGCRVLIPELEHCHRCW